MTAPVNRPHRKPGRKPTPYDETAALDVCVELMSGRTLRSICEDEAAPSRRAVYTWLAVVPAFRDAYARAREAQMQGWADDIIEIADDTSQDYVDREKADGSIEKELNAEAVQRSKIRIDARKWLMSKLAPRTFADKVEVEVSTTVKIEALTDEELEAKARQALTAMGVALPDAPLIIGLPVEAGGDDAGE